MRSRVDQICEQAQHLSPREKIALVKKLLDTLRVSISSLTQEPLDLRELRGMGKGLWTHDDVQAYIDQEREAWER